jgi:hypothetical protein
MQAWDGSEWERVFVSGMRVVMQHAYVLKEATCSACIGRKPTRPLCNQKDCRWRVSFLPLEDLTRSR